MKDEQPELNKKEDIVFSNKDVAGFGQTDVGQINLEQSVSDSKRAPQYSVPSCLPYTRHPVYQDAQKKSRSWIWLLTVCLIALVLGTGGCIGCVTRTVFFSEKSAENNIDSVEEHVYPYKAVNSDYYEASL